MKKISGLLFTAFILLAPLPVSANNRDVLPSLQSVIREVTEEYDQIPPERQNALKKVAGFIRSQLQAKETPQLTFICTHNSRRSHLSQIWAQTAATYYDIPGVRTFSGGTEVTACNERTVAALQRAGFEVSNSTPDRKNPLYLVKYSPSRESLPVFSKIYSAEGNPKSNFIALMTCGSADESCPVVAGSVLRVPIPYVDPKLSDGSKDESATYDERCRQIAREMFFLMKNVQP